MSESTGSSREKIAILIIRLACAWVVAGALFKLFAGSPNDLPPLVKKFPLGPVQTFRSAIAIELCIVILALLRPRFGWLPLAALFAVFIGVLVPLTLSGAESCGCFGSSVTIPPQVMIGIDAALLALILATRPWSAFGNRPLRLVPLVPLFAVAIAAPWYKFKTATTLKPEPAVETAATNPEQAEVPAGWSLPDPLPDFHWFESDGWVGNDVHDIDLSIFIDPDLIPLDGEVVFYRQTCDHCKEHLEELATNPPLMPLTLVRVAEIGDTPENEVTHIKPADHIPLELPALERGYGLDTPSRMLVEGWTVTEYEAIAHED